MSAPVASASPPCLTERRRMCGPSWMATRRSILTTTSTRRAAVPPGSRACLVDHTARITAPVAKPHQHGHRRRGALRRLALGLAYFALASAAVLLLLDEAPGFLQGSIRPVVSATPLLAIGAAFLAAQIVLRPAPAELVKRILLSVAFFLWGANALFSEYVWAALLNDAAIALFVVDLALITRGHLHHPAGEPAGYSTTRGSEERS